MRGSVTEKEAELVLLSLQQWDVQEIDFQHAKMNSRTDLKSLIKSSRPRF